jgi:hypothetical protein
VCYYVVSDALAADVQVVFEHFETASVVQDQGNADVVLFGDFARSGDAVVLDVVVDVVAVGSADVVAVGAADVVAAAVMIMKRSL